jgi:hypothetical protein
MMQNLRIIVAEVEGPEDGCARSDAVVRSSERTANTIAAVNQEP